MTSKSFLFVLPFMLCASAHADMISVDWKSADMRSAVGTLMGSLVTVTTSEDAEFTELFQPFNQDNWQAEMPLPDDTNLLGVGNANAGDSQTFVIEEPLTDVLMYIENFDSNSVAVISVEGSSLDGIDLLTGSPSITLEDISMDSGSLLTANMTSDGEGDAILQFFGSIRSISLDYSAGDGANGVFYTLAMPMTQAVPEPSMQLSLLLGLGFVLSAWRRSRK